MPKIVPENAVLIPKEAECVFSGILFEAYHWQQKLFDGSYATFEMLRRIDSVVVIAVIEDEIIVIFDEQPNRNGARASLPGGRIDKGETPLAAAKRELVEETGFELSKWQLLDVTQPEPKLEWFIYTYVAFGAIKRRAAEAGPGEIISLKLDSFDDFKLRCMNFEGFLGETLPLIMNVTNIQELLSIPEFIGKEVA